MSGTPEIARENGKKGGRPKGTKSQSTLEKEAVLKAFKERAMKHADILFNAQLTLARGQTFLYKIEKEKIVGPKGGVSYRSKPPKLVTNQWEIEHFLEYDLDNTESKEQEDTYYYLTTKEPSNMAVDSLLDRTFGKSTQSVDVTSKGEQINVIDPSKIALAKKYEEEIKNNL